MSKIIVEYHYDIADVKIGDKTKIVYAEDLSEIAELLNFIGKNLSIEIEERDCN